MNSERAQAYGRLMKAVRAEGPEALEPREGVTRVGDLAGDLVGSGRWAPDRAEQLLRDIEACGPMATVP
jgi:hypothetical protein